MQVKGSLRKPTSKTSVSRDKPDHHEAYMQESDLPTPEVNINRERDGEDPRRYEAQHHTAGESDRFVDLVVDQEAEDPISSKMSRDNQTQNEIRPS